MTAEGKKDSAKMLEKSEEARKLELFEADLRDFTFPDNLAPEILESFEEVIQRYKSYT